MVRTIKSDNRLKQYNKCNVMHFFKCLNQALKHWYVTFQKQIKGEIHVNFV